MIDWLIDFVLNYLPLWLYLLISLAFGLSAVRAWFIGALDDASTWTTFKTYTKGLAGVCGLISTAGMGLVYGFNNTLSAIENDPARTIINEPIVESPMQHREDVLAIRLKKVLDLDGNNLFGSVSCMKVLGSLAAVLERTRQWDAASDAQKRAAIEHAQARWQQVRQEPFSSQAAVYVDPLAQGLVLGGSHRGPGLSTWLITDSDAPRMMRSAFDIHLATLDDEHWLRREALQGRQ